MSWLDPAWASRLPITVDNSAGGAGASDLQIQLTAENAAFWASVQADGDDIRITAANGVGLATIKLTAWNYASKTATVEVDSVALDASAVMGMWLYYGNATASSGFTSPTISAPKTAVPFVARPASSIVVRPPPPDQSAPPERVTKSTGEARWLWWDFGAQLIRAPHAISGQDYLEEIASVITVESLTGLGVNTSAMLDLTLTRIVGYGVVGTWIKAGSDATSYTARCVVRTSLNRTLEGRAVVQVRNLLET